ncbi:MAG: hypothetical protein V3573_12195 [Desulfovibrionaceae bacterium]
MKKFLSLLLFAAVIGGALLFSPILGQKLDMPFESGKLKAPDIVRHHDAAPGHGESMEQGHGQETHSALDPAEKKTA